MKTKIFTSLMIVVPVYIFSQESFWGMESFSPSPIDARSIAMGRTSIVSATGSNSIFSNPGTIATLDSRQLQVGGRMIMGDVEHEAKENYYDSYKKEILEAKDKEELVS